MADWLNAAQLKALMESYTFNGMTMLEFLNSADRKFATNQSDRIELYPLLEAMSPAQRRMLAYNPLDQLLITGMLDEAGWEETYDEQSEILESQTAMSIYEGVNRSVLDSCSIALTGDAFDKQTATKVQALNSGMFGGGLDFTAPLTFSAGIALMTAGAVMISKGDTYFASMRSSAASSSMFMPYTA